jgi:hypothetical protein
LADLPPHAVDWDVALRLGNDWYDRLVTAMREPDRSRRIEKLAAADKYLQQLAAEVMSVEDLSAHLKSAMKPEQAAGRLIGAALLPKFLPSVTTPQDAEDRPAQQRRNLRLAFALSAYQRDHDAYPPQLADLAPK